MKIVILGATGNIGSRLVTTALDAGHEVVAYVRRPDAVTRRAGLTVVMGELDDEVGLAKAFAGADAVVSAIGVPMRAKKPIDLMQRSLPLITRAATKAGVDRLVVVSAFGVGETAAKASPFARLIYRTLVAKIFKDKELSERILPDSGLNWTTVYPVNLKDAPAAPNTAIKNLADVASVPGLPTLPFANAASALLKITGDLSLSGQRVLITTEKGWKPKQR